MFSKAIARSRLVSAAEEADEAGGWVEGSGVAEEKSPPCELPLGALSLASSPATKALGSGDADCTIVVAILFAFFETAIETCKTLSCNCLRFLSFTAFSASI